MMGGTALAIIAISPKRQLVSRLVWGCLGIFTVLVPIIVYFLYLGNMQAFIQEYFINTLEITDRNLFSCFVRDKILITILFVSLILFRRYFGISRCFLFMYFPFYVFLLLRSVFLHYFITAMPFTVFPLILITTKLSVTITKTPNWLFAIVLTIISCSAVSFNIHKIYFATSNSPLQVREAVMKYIAKKSKPKIMFTDGDGGQGLCARALPACKYWAQQKAASKDMKKAREEAVRKRKADFIVVTNLPETPRNFIPLMKKYGYRQCSAELMQSGKKVIVFLPLYKK